MTSNLEVFTGSKISVRQESIPVGCVPSTAVAARGGRVLPKGCASRGVCVCFPGLGVCFPGCVCVSWGGGRGGGVYPSMHWVDTPPPENRMTDACENITLPQLRCGR